MRASIKDNNLFQKYASTINIDLADKETKKIDIYPYIKRLLDILLSIIGILLSTPIIIFVGILIKLESPGPIFYTQERVGLYGKYFKIIKLRSMRVDAEKYGAQWAEKDDPRVTRIGSLIRKTRIDELPQFWNVLIGDMSLVGPRPERPMFTAQFIEEIPGFVERLKVKPGITGWAQINGGYDITPKEKLVLDRYYITNMSFLLDMKILIKSIIVCLTGKGAR